MPVSKPSRAGLAAAALAAAVPAPSAPATAQDLPGERIPYRSELALEVGERQVIHGWRGECGRSPGDPADLWLPTLSHGELSTGRTGWRRSRSCGGATPAIEVIDEATSPGEDRFELFGDRITVTVSE
ncbi:MAG: hypothetical protein AAGI51_07310 [Pseudomonadota bacterium]